MLKAILTWQRTKLAFAIFLLGFAAGAAVLLSLAPS
jgi:hypothetical protein